MRRLSRAMISRRKVLTKLLILGVVVVFCFMYYGFESLQEIKVKENSDMPYVLYHASASKTAERSRSEVNRSSRHEDPLSVGRVAEYCYIPSQTVTRPEDEGEAPKGYVLSSVYTAIRHGDRTPLNSFLNIPQPAPPDGCMMDSTFLQSHPELRHFVEDMQAQKDQQPPHSEFSSWSLFPQRKICDSSQLTGRGAKQHLLNGLILKKKYVTKWNLFGDSFLPSRQIAVYSTLTSRTYQSAVALLYGFLPRFNISEVQIHAAHSLMFCKSSLVPNSCCSNLAKLKREADQAASIPRGENSTWISLMAPLADVFGVKTSKLPRASRLVDILHGHACHGLKLPCGEGGKCVTSAMMKKLWEFMDFSGALSAQHATFDRYCRTVMHSLLFEIMRNMVQVSRGYSPIKFSLFSGHDLTLTPLLQVLGVNDGKWPHYATRVVLELYRKNSSEGENMNSKDNSNNYYLRILHSGRDVTSRVRFCRGRTVDGMCPLKRFQFFVERENFEAIGVADRQAFESFCRSKTLF